MRSLFASVCREWCTITLLWTKRRLEKLLLQPSEGVMLAFDTREKEEPPLLAVVVIIRYAGARTTDACISVLHQLIESHPSPHSQQMESTSRPRSPMHKVMSTIGDL